MLIAKLSLNSIKNFEFVRDSTHRKNDLIDRLIFEFDLDQKFISIAATLAGCKKQTFSLPLLSFRRRKKKDLLFGILNPRSPFFFSNTTHIPIE
jgi:hypothetical protein